MGWGRLGGGDRWGGGGHLAAGNWAFFRTGGGQGSSYRRVAGECQFGDSRTGVSIERFRKHHERIVLEQVAEEVLAGKLTSWLGKHARIRLPTAPPPSRRRLRAD